MSTVGFEAACIKCGKKTKNAASFLRPKASRIKRGWTFIFKPRFLKTGL